MAKNTSIALGQHFQNFVEDKIEEGRFGSASEVVRAGLRLFEEREARLEASRAAIDEGLASGKAEPFDFEAFMRERDREPKRG